MRYGKSVRLEAETLRDRMYKAGVDCPDLFGIGDNLRELVKLSREHCKLVVHQCNGTYTPRMESRERNIEKRVTEIAQSIGLKATFDGDPRGYTVKLHAPKGNFYNTWGGAETGYGIGDIS